MSKVLKELLTANKNYADNFKEKANLAMPPKRRFAILTCMDARLDPAKFAGIAEGDAHVIRNAGGRASDDAIRSLIISHKLLGTKEWFVIHHTNCGMETFTNEIISDLLSKSLSTSTLVDDGWYDDGIDSGTSAAKSIDWLTISNQAKSVYDDVLRIRSHPLVAKDIPVFGYLFDVKTGQLVEIPEATAVGKPTELSHSVRK